MGLLDLLYKSNPKGQSLDGQLPRSYSPPSDTVEVFLQGSQLDLDGKTPSDAYANTAPENQSGRV
jgi:hypothetical protein